MPRNMGEQRMSTNKEYKEREHRDYLNGKGFFDSLADFIADHSEVKADWFETQLEWIENGSYGAGACLELCKVWDWVSTSPRANKQAAIGQVLLSCLYGKKWEPRHWHKLPPAMQSGISEAVTAWIAGNREFVITWDD